jgi:acyl-CoA synthetase (AMP-forming)/AMP-acid ligase II
MEWKVIRITDGPIATMADAEVLPAGEIGELIVQGGVVTTEYVTRTDANALHKIKDGDKFWHRMGDVGYLEVMHAAGGDDRSQRFWFCGRKSHRVTTAGGTLFTIPCEAIFNQHERIYRSALVGVGSPGKQRPVIIAEPWPEKWPRNEQDRLRILYELAVLGAKHPHTVAIQDFFLMETLPTDIRHNAKIFREKLAVWAAKKLAS